MASWFKFLQRKSGEYGLVEAESKSLDSNTDPDIESVLDDERPKCIYQPSPSILLPWITTLFLFCLVSYQHLKATSILANSWEGGWSTDFYPAKHLIKVEKVKFNGGPAYDKNGMFVPHPDPIQYVGSPSKEIDANWKNLINPRYFPISEEEAEATYGIDYQQYWNPEFMAYMTGLDMFHTLHCLDFIRRFIHPNHYNISSYQDREMHFGHCIEHIRQYIMCAGDLTPIPTRYFPSAKHSYVDPEQMHTCRNFPDIREWVVERSTMNFTYKNIPFEKIV